MFNRLMFNRLGAGIWLVILALLPADVFAFQDADAASVENAIHAQNAAARQHLEACTDHDDAEMDMAQRFVAQSLGLVEGNSRSVETSLQVETYLLAARIEYQDNRGTFRLGQYARSALELLGDDEQESAGFAELAYYRATENRDRPWFEFMYYLLLARNGFETAPPEDDTQRRLQIIANVRWAYAMDEMRARSLLRYRRYVERDSHPWSVWPSEEDSHLDAYLESTGYIEPSVWHEPHNLYQGFVVGGATEGYTIVQFDIDPNGHTTNVELVHDVPRERYDDVALQAVNLWEFDPVFDENGQAIARQGVIVRLTHDADFRHLR